MDGLKDIIKSVILVQRPVNFDTAYALAPLQEEADLARRHKHGRPDVGFRLQTSVGRTPLPLSLPPTKWINQLGVAQATETRPHDTAQVCLAYEKVAL
jgi:hypothetical protein